MNERPHGGGEQERVNRSMLDVSRWLLKAVRLISSRGTCMRACLRAGSRLGSYRADSDVET